MTALPLLGHLVPFLRDPLGFVEGLHREQGPYATFSLGPDRYLMVAAPEGLQHVFVDHHERYAKGNGYDGVKLVLRSGLLTSDGELWRLRRKATQPAFRPERLDGYVAAIDAAVADAHARWVVKGELDLHAELVAVTIDVVGRTLLGGPLARRAETVREALEAVIAFAWSYGNEPIRLPLWLPTPTRRRFHAALAVLRGVAEETIARRDGLVPLLAHLDEDAVLDEVLTMLLAGHETTATALTFAIAALIAHPSWAERVRAEAGALPEVPDAAAVHALTATASAWFEALRLWPPVWFFERRATVDDEVAGFPVRAGTMVGASPWAIHRDPALWPEPQRFDPARFAGGPPGREHRFRWVPFSLGPRTCIGLRLATLEAQLVLARTFGRFELLPVGDLPRPVAKLTLRPTPFRVRVRR